VTARLRDLIGTDAPPTCVVCGIEAVYLSIPQAWIHAEPRTLANRLHNGAPDHNAVVVR
jgi:hypothetical protein